MTPDIIEVVAASRGRIAAWHASVSESAAWAGGPRSPQRRAAAWDTVLRLIMLHMAAEDEICLPAVREAAPDGWALPRAVLDDHEDVRELIREACLQPPGSPRWKVAGRGRPGRLDCPGRPGARHGERAAPLRPAPPSAAGPPVARLHRRV